MNKRVYTCHPSVTAEVQPAGCMRPIGNDGYDLWHPSHGDYHRTLSPYDLGHEAFLEVYYQGGTMPATYSRRFAEGFNKARANRQRYTDGGVKRIMDLFKRGVKSKEYCLKAIQVISITAKDWPDMPPKLEITLTHSSLTDGSSYHDESVLVQHFAGKEKISEQMRDNQGIDY